MKPFKRINVINAKDICGTKDDYMQNLKVQQAICESGFE